MGSPQCVIADEAAAESHKAALHAVCVVRRASSDTPATGQVSNAQTISQTMHESQSGLADTGAAELSLRCSAWVQPTHPSVKQLLGQLVVCR